MIDKDIRHIKESGNYRLLHELSYNRIVPFVFENIRRRTFSSNAYFILNIITLVLILYFLLPGTLAEKITFRNFFLQFLTGLFAGSILVIPFHEGFHALAYKLAGAPKIHFGADFQQMIFYVSADQYPVGRGAFYFVAMAPFIMLNLLALTSFLITGLIPLHTLLFFMLFHNIMCIGDFAMVSFFQAHKEKELVTFDDLNGKVSYIYEKTRDDNS